MKIYCWDPDFEPLNEDPPHIDCLSNFNTLCPFCANTCDENALVCVNHNTIMFWCDHCGAIAFIDGKFTKSTHNNHTICIDVETPGTIIFETNLIYIKKVIGRDIHREDEKIKAEIFKQESKHLLWKDAPMVDSYNIEDPAKKYPEATDLAYDGRYVFFIDNCNTFYWYAGD